MSLGSRRYDPVEPGFCLQRGKVGKPPGTVCTLFHHTKKMRATHSEPVDGDSRWMFGVSRSQEPQVNVSSNTEIGSTRTKVDGLNGHWRLGVIMTTTQERRICGILGELAWSRNHWTSSHQSPGRLYLRSDTNPLDFSPCQVPTLSVSVFQTCGSIRAEPRAPSDSGGFSGK